MDRNIIENLMQDIIKAYEIEIPILNIDALVSKLGGQVKELPDYKHAYSDGVKKDGEGFLICILPYQDKQRRTFRIAQELGNLFLNMGFKTNPDLWNSQPEGKIFRTKATEENFRYIDFAYALLMPKNEYIRIAKEYTHGKTVETKKIAEHFGVSVSDASHRGIMLGYLEDIWNI